MRLEIIIFIFAVILACAQAKLARNRKSFRLDATSFALTWDNSVFVDSADTTIVDIATDSSNNLFILGSTTGALYKEAKLDTSQDMYIAKLDTSNGNVDSSFQYQYGNSSNEIPTSMVVDSSNNIFVVGTTDGKIGSSTSNGGIDGFLLKITPDGSFIVQVQFGTSSDDTPVAVDIVQSSSTIIVAGNQGSHIFLRSFSSSGSPGWSKTFSSSGIDVATDMVVDSSGSIIMVGYTTSTLFGSTHSGSEDIFVAKFSSADGSLVWNKNFGTTAKDVAYSVAVDSAKNIYVGALTNGILSTGTPQPEATQAAFIKLTTDGTTSFTKQFDTPSSSGMVGIKFALSKDDSAIYTAVTFSYIPESSINGILMAKYSALDGSTIYTSEMTDDTYSNNIYVIIRDRAGDFVSGGYAKETGSTSGMGTFGKFSEFGNPVPTSSPVAIAPTRAPTSPPNRVPTKPPSPKPTASPTPSTDDEASKDDKYDDDFDFNDIESEIFFRSDVTFAGFKSLTVSKSGRQALVGAMQSSLNYTYSNVSFAGIQVARRRLHSVSLDVFLSVIVSFNCTLYVKDSTQTGNIYKATTASIVSSVSSGAMTANLQMYGSQLGTTEFSTATASSVDNSQPVVTNLKTTTKKTKPKSIDGMAIGLEAGVPVVVIILVATFLWWYLSGRKSVRVSDSSNLHGVVKVG